MTQSPCCTCEPSETPLHLSVCFSTTFKAVSFINSHTNTHKPQHTLKKQTVLTTTRNKHKHVKNTDCLNDHHTSCISLVVGPSSADSANSHQGDFSRVQKAKGIAGGRKKKQQYYSFITDDGRKKSDSISLSQTPEGRKSDSISLSQMAKGRKSDSISLSHMAKGRKSNSISLP